ncbi:transposase family protein [Rhizobacter sp. J219]|uniref:transposase family protein n=1 Tax=Rhizobacter sp. J219 TaxID=2898430 RepID=UPI002151279B|nr:transposase family protein [Rhizobacter sp. J219]MCR5883727.1 transposase family protein [Rhizobacter sp. J219]
MKFSLSVGLVLRHGQRTLELKRVLSDSELQFEEVLTGRATLLDTNDVLKGIWAKKYAVVLGGIALSGGKAEGDLGVDAESLLPAADIGSLPKAWMEEIERRLAYIKGVVAAHATPGQRQAINKCIKTTAGSIHDDKLPSASAVMDWYRSYRRAGFNPLVLVSKTRWRRRSLRLNCLVDETIRKVLKAEYFTRDRHTLKHAQGCIVRDLKELTAAGALPAKDAKVSLTTLRRRVAEVDVYQRIASREGDARARMVCRTSVTGAAASYPLQRVELDHTPLNWVAICDRTGLPLGRPLLTFAIDAFSGYGLGMYLSFYGPGVTSVSGVIRNAIEPKGELPPGFNLENRWLSYGVADEYVLDNGLEFHAAAFKRMCWSLGSDMTYCRVRTPWLKPHVERFFAGLDHLTLAKGRVTKHVANVLRIDPYKDACITFSDLVRGLTKFIVDVHPFQVNERKLARPYDLFLEGIERCPPAAYPHDPKSLRLTSGLSNVQTVDHGGVNLLGIPYGGRELLDLRKRVGKPFRTMCRWDPDDLDTIQVQDPHNPTRWHSADRLWPDYARGLSWNQHRLIRKFKREELSATGAEEQLMAARLQLHDMWKDVTRPGKRADSLMAARAAGFTSSRVFAGVEAAEPDCRVLVTPSAAPSEADAIPEFDSFDLEAA